MRENSKNDIKEEKKQNVLRRSQQLLDGNTRERRERRRGDLSVKRLLWRNFAPGTCQSGCCVGCGGIYEYRSVAGKGGGGKEAMRRRRSQLEGICGSLGVDHGPKLLLLCIIGCS